jgi:hypothetical protein
MPSVDDYYKLLNLILESKKKKNFEKMLSYCDNSLPKIPALIKETKHDFGSFDLKSIPAIEIGLIFWAVFENRSKITKIQNLVNQYPDLEPWKNNVNESFETLDLVNKIMGLLKESSIKQNEMKLMIGQIDGKKVSNILYYLDLIGKVERVKNGNTYEVKIKNREQKMNFGIFSKLFK